MAVISRIRKHSGWLVALIGISIAGFILQDAFSGRNQGGRIPKFAVINKTEIKLQQFEEKVEQLSENFRRASGEMQITPEDLYEIRQRVWMTMVNDLLLDNACQKLGLSITQKEMNDMFYGQFIHQQVYRNFVNPETGMFDRQRVMMLINNFSELPVDQQKIWHDLEIAVKEDRLKTKYYNIVANAYYVPAFYAKYLYSQVNSSMEAHAASLSYADVSDEDIKLSDSDYKTYYNKHKALFKRAEESRAIDFVVFDVLPTEQDLADLDKQATDLYAEFLVEQNLPDFINAVSTERFDSIYLKKELFGAPWDSVLFRAPKGTYFKPTIRNNRYEMAKLIDVSMRPDSLRASHIVITYRGAAVEQANQRTKEEAKRIADSLQTVILRDRTQFAAIAQVHSESETKANGGDLGWMPDGYLLKPMNEAIVKGNVGDVMVIETNTGYHVIAITGKTRPVEKAMAAFVYVPIEPSTKTSKNIYTQANQFFSKCQDLESFLKAAEEAKIQVRQAEYVSAMEMRLPGLANARDMVRWAYDKNTETGQMASEIYEYENKYVIAALRQIRKKGDPSLDEIKAIPEVLYAVRNEKKAEMLMEKMQNALKSDRSIAALTTLNADIDTIGQLMFNAYNLGQKPFEPEVIGTAFAQKENQVSAPIKGRSGVYVIQTLKQTSAEMLPENQDLFQSQMQMMFQQQMTENIRIAMENAAKITDNRAFYF